MTEVTKFNGVLFVLVAATLSLGGCASPRQAPPMSVTLRERLDAIPHVEGHIAWMENALSEHAGDRLVTIRNGPHGQSFTVFERRLEDDTVVGDLYLGCSGDSEIIYRERLYSVTHPKAVGMFQHLYEQAAMGFELKVVPEEEYVAFPTPAAYIMTFGRLNGTTTCEGVGYFASALWETRCSGFLDSLGEETGFPPPDEVWEIMDPGQVASIALYIDLALHEYFDVMCQAADVGQKTAESAEQP